MNANILGHPDWFIPTLRFVLQQEVWTPRSPLLRFELSQQAAERNKAILQQHGNNLQNYLLTQKDTHIYFGAEFRDASILHRLLCHHPTWYRFKRILEKGSNWPTQQISNQDRRTKNKGLIDRGNHKSALKYSNDLQIRLKKRWNKAGYFLCHSPIFQR
jgi:hypothetical protein